MIKILTVPVIDLEHEVPEPSRRTPRRHLQILVTLATGALLLGLDGEPYDPPSPSLDDMATICPLVLLLGDTSPDVHVVDPATGDVLRIVHCPA